MRNYTIESVDNAMRLLLLLQRDGRLRLCDAAAELGLARSTTHRLLGTLSARGFAVQDRDRLYCPGPALHAPARRRITTPDLRHLAHPHLLRLNRQTGETVHLMVRIGTDVRFLDSVEGTQALRVGSRAGVTLPAHRTSGGKALLAELSGSELEALYGENGSRADLPALRRMLTRVRRHGYGVNTDESEPGITAVGMCVFDRDERACAALTLSAPSVRFPRARILEVVPLIRAAVDEMGADLVAR